jgi:hypothetical protein
MSESLPVDKSINEVIDDVDKLFSEKFEKFRSENIPSLAYNDEDGLDIQLIKCHSAYMRINDIYAREKHTYNKMKAKYERLYAEMIDVAKQNPLMYRTTNEIDGFIIRDSKIAKAKAHVQNQLEFVEYIQSVLDMLKSKRFDLKTISDIRKSEFTRIN